MWLGVAAQITPLPSRQVCGVDILVSRSKPWHPFVASPENAGPSTLLRFPQDDQSHFKTRRGNWTNLYGREA